MYDFQKLYNDIEITRNRLTDLRGKKQSTLSFLDACTHAELPNYKAVDVYVTPSITVVFTEGGMYAVGIKYYPDGDYRTEIIRSDIYSAMGEEIEKFKYYLSENEIEKFKILNREVFKIEQEFSNLIKLEGLMRNREGLTAEQVDSFRERAKNDRS